MNREVIDYIDKGVQISSGDYLFNVYCDFWTEGLDVKVACNTIEDESGDERRLTNEEMVELDALVQDFVDEQPLDCLERMLGYEPWMLAKFIE